MLAGLELLAIPLSGVLIKGAIKLVIYIGIGGVFGTLIGILMITAGIVLWANPTHRVFYSIAGAVLGLISFPASNLGGFFIGMLMAMIGGAIGFAWTPDEPEAAETVPGEAHPPLSEPRATFTPRSDGRAVAETIADGFPALKDTDDLGGGTDGGPAGRHRMLAIAAMPAVIVAGMMGVTKPASGPQSGTGCILGIFCTSSSPSPSPSPSPTSSSGGLLPLPLPSGSAGSSGGGILGGVLPSPSASPSSTKAPKAPKAKNTTAPQGVVAPNATSELTTGSAVLTNFNFVGNTTLPRLGGGTEQVMEFTSDSTALTKHVHITVSQNGSTTVSDAGSFVYTDGMTLYTTKMCGEVEGITPDICFTPTTVSAALLKLAGVLGKTTPITMLNASIYDPLVSSGQLVVTPTKMGVAWG
jgi:hypothetical protein